MVEPPLRGCFAEREVVSERVRSEQGGKIENWKAAKLPVVAARPKSGRQSRTLRSLLRGGWNPLAEERRREVGNFREIP